MEYFDQYELLMQEWFKALHAKDDDKMVELEYRINQLNKRYAAGEIEA